MIYTTKPMFYEMADIQSISWIMQQLYINDICMMHNYVTNKMFATDNTIMYCIIMCVACVYSVFTAWYGALQG